MPPRPASVSTLWRVLYLLEYGTILIYSPLSAATADRLAAISREFRRASIVVLAGTQRLAREYDVEVEHTVNHYFGGRRVAGEDSNEYVPLWSGPPHSTQVAKKVFDWFHEAPFSGAASRTMPLLALDLKDGLGLQGSYDRIAEVSMMRSMRRPQIVPTAAPRDHASLLLDIRALSMPPSMPKREQYDIDAAMLALDFTSDSSWPLLVECVRSGMLRVFHKEVVQYQAYAKYKDEREQQLLCSRAQLREGLATGDSELPVKLKLTMVFQQGGEQGHQKVMETANKILGSQGPDKIAIEAFEEGDEDQLTKVNIVAHTSSTRPLYRAS